MEVAGSLGDLGTLIPLAVGMIVINGLEATSVLMCIGLFYVGAGLYFGLPTPVQPMKVIGAYAIAAALTPAQIVASTAWMAVVLLLLGLTGLIDVIRRYTPHAVIRGVQLALGVVLLVKGLDLMIARDPGLAVHAVGPVGTGVLLGVSASILTLILRDNRKLPAALVILVLGLLCGLLLGATSNGTAGSATTIASIGLHLPHPLPYGLPSWADVVWVLPVLVLPQLPMTVGNAVISSADLAHQYFPEKSGRVTVRAMALSQGLANTLAALLGGIPMCHGAGGLAAHYRFGQRTAGGNLVIGGGLLLLAVLFGSDILWFLGLLPLAILGVLLAFAGLELALLVRDLKGRDDYFVALLMLGLALASNLAVAFLAGLVVAPVLRALSDRAALRAPDEGRRDE
jgi:SulP family sulfate permease